MSIDMRAFRKLLDDPDAVQEMTRRLNAVRDITQAPWPKAEVDADTIDVQEPDPLPVDEPAEPADDNVGD